jgi:hypothetical protein
MAGVQLKTVEYAELLEKPNDWTVKGLTLGPVNLIVGKNASGKTRTMNVIANLAGLFMPNASLGRVHGRHDFVFDSDGQKLQYIVRIADGKAVFEELLVNDVSMFDRASDHTGQIYNADEKRKMRFRPPDSELAAVVRRDSLQHPFVEPLHEWAMSLRHYTFGASLGKDSVALILMDGREADERDNTQVVSIFRKAVDMLGRPFIEAVLRDMGEMRYDLEDIAVTPPANFKVLRDGNPTEVLVLSVKERGIGGMIEQGELSQGMFRALSILIQVNYSQMAKRASCILIDDIGEGLDFERSTSLIEILRRKAKDEASSFQLVMTTNDRFVMNHVPLEEWSILQREGCTVTVRNQNNSKQHFDTFKMMGLNNFDFLRYDFINEDPGKLLEDDGNGAQ